MILLALGANRAAAVCVGDCNGDDSVVINELITGVRIATGAAEMDACPDFDTNDDGEVAVNELVRGVAAATNGCVPGAGGTQVDTTQPKVTRAAALSATSVLIAFSEPLLRTDEDLSAEDARNYSLTPGLAGVSPAIVTTARLNAAKTQAVLTTLPLVAGVEYRVRVARVRDEAGNALDTSESVWVTFAGQPGDELPRVVGSASLGNKSVIVQFSALMGDSAIDPTHYSIVQANVHPEAGTLDVTAAEFTAGSRTSVRLTTRSQNELTYTLTAVTVTDLAGNPLAPKRTVGGKTIDPSSASFPGTPPSCGEGRLCTNGSGGVGGSGACSSDADCAVYAPCTAGGDHWRLLGLAGETIGALAIDPTNPQILYAAGRGAGKVFKSIDGGTTWSMTASGLGSVGALAIDPQTPSTVYAGGDRGVFASLDGGAHWSSANGNLPAGFDVAALAVDPHTPRIIYAGGILRVQGGRGGAVIYRSTDRGESWGSGPSYRGSRGQTVVAIALNPIDPTILYAGSEAGLHKSVDSGTTWFLANLSAVPVAAIAVDPRTPTTVYAGTRDTGVYRSRDEGGSWTQSAGLGRRAGVEALAVDANDSRTLYAAGESECGPQHIDCVGGRYRSTDGGDAWVRVEDGLVRPPGAGVLVTISGAVFTSTEEGLYLLSMCPSSACQDTCDLRDTDGDGVPDNDEQRGWTVSVRQADGQIVQRDVTSDLTDADTDDDGLTDREEQQLRTDPNSADTDSDGLSDAFERNVLYSNPLAQDSDGDGLLDGREVRTFKTSPILADTDGDQLTDAEELQLNRDPVIADVPNVLITVGDVRLQIEETFTYTDERGETVSEDASTTSTLTRSEHGSFVTDHDYHDFSVSEIDAGASFGINGGGISDMKSNPSPLVTIFQVGGIEALIHVDRSDATDKGDTWVDSSESAKASQSAFEETAARVRERASSSSITRQVTGARIDVDLTIENAGSLAFTVGDLEITVLQRSALDTNQLVPVATLVSNQELVTGEPLAVNIGPINRTRGPLLFTSRDAFPALVQELMRAPHGLVFKIANYDLTDELGRSFAFANQTVRDRTAQIIIDSGDMGAERYFVATSGVLAGANPRDGLVGGFDDHGRAKGLPLDYVLQNVLGLKKFVPGQTQPDGIVAGLNQTADSYAEGDDVQLIPPGTTGVSVGSIVIGAGANGVIDSIPNRRCQRTPTPTTTPPTTTPPTTTPPTTTPTTTTPTTPSDDCDDDLEYVTGYETSRTCDQLSQNASEACSDNSKCRPSGQRGGVCETSLICDRLSQNASAPCSDNSDCHPSPLGGVCASPERLVRVGSLRNGDFNRAWVVLATGDQPAAADFGSLEARAHEDLKLLFVQDLDRDGLFAPDEFLAGSLDSGVDRFKNSSFGLACGAVTAPPPPDCFDLDEALQAPPQMPRYKCPGVPGHPEKCDGIPDSQDTDFDGLGDFAEVKVGWKVSTEAGLMQVFSSPRSRDSDGDGLEDLEERNLSGFCAEDVIVAGADGRADSAVTANSDDVQLIPPGTTGLGAHSVVIDPGPNGTIESTIAGDDQEELSDPRIDGVCAFQNDPVEQIEADGIVAGRNGVADTAATGDDEQLVPVGTTGLPYDTAIVGPGQNKLIDTVIKTAMVDDKYTSLRSVPPASDPSRRDTDDDGVTDFEELSGFVAGLAIVDGGNGYAETLAQADDVQRAEFLQPVVPGGAVILPGPDGRIESSPPSPMAGDDVVIPVRVGTVGSTYRFRIGCGPNGILETIGNRFVGCPGSSCTIENQVSADQNAVHEPLYARCNDPLRGIDLANTDNSPTPPTTVKPNNATPDDVFHFPDVVVTDPLRRDTDSDTIADGTEREQGSDPTVADGTDFRDADQDGLFDAEETDLGWDVSVDNGNPVHVLSSPGAADTDGDGLPDLIERYLRTDPNRADTDGDGITDFDEVADFPTFVRLSAPYPGIVINGSNSKSYGTNPRRRDTDGDGLTDLEEVSGYGFVGADRVRKVVVTDPLRADTDSDGLTDKQERDRTDDDDEPAPTDATNPDTDGDGKLDGAETKSDPLMADHHVTVVFTQLNANKLIEDPSYDRYAALGYWFLVTDPAGVEHHVMSTSTTSPPVPADIPSFIPFTPAINDDCRLLVYQSGRVEVAGGMTTVLVPEAVRLDLEQDPHQEPFELDLHPGDSFTVHGLWADFYSILDNGAVETTTLDKACGKPPHYAPRSFKSSCYLNFSYHYDYADIAGSSQPVIRVDTTDKTTTRRNDGCDVDMHFEIRID